MIAGLAFAMSFALIGFGLRTLIVSAGDEKAIESGAACLGSGLAGIGLAILVLVIA